MEHWRVQYLGLREIPLGLDDFELTTFFSYDAGEQRLIASRRSALHRLALALHIGFVRMSGRTLDALERVPKRLWSHIAKQVHEQAPEIATLRSLYSERPRTLADHQKIAYEALGFQRMTEHQRRYVVRWLRETLVGRSGTAALLPELKRWFYEHRILLIADRELRRLIADAVRDRETQLLEELKRAYGEERLGSWDKALVATRPAGQALQSWLIQAPLKQSTRQISRMFDRLDVLREMGACSGWPEEINEAAVRFYGRRCANRPPTVSKRIKPGRRLLEVGCFLRYAACSVTDQIFLMIRRWIKAMANKAGKDTAPRAIDAQARLRELAKAVRALAADEALSLEELRARLIAAAEKSTQEGAISMAALARAWLIEHSRQARAVLAQLCEVPIESDGAHPVTSALAVLKEVYAAKARVLPGDVAIDLGRRWREAIEDADRAKALRAFEWATLFKLRVSLRNGSVFVGHSFGFRGHAALLIPQEDWQAQRNHHYGHLELPQDPKEFIGKIRSVLERRVADFAKDAAAGLVRVDDTGIHLTPQAPTPEAQRVADLRRALYAHRGTGQLAEMLLYVDSKVRFSWQLLGREPYNRKELLLVYASLLNLGTAMTAAAVARMVPSLSAESVRQMSKRLCDERNLRAAADSVFQYLQRFEIAEHWGRSDLASSDMISLQTPRAIWQARADPRRKTASIGVYGHVHDRWGVFYDQPIVLNRRQAGAALEGMVRQQVATELNQLAVDTHGFTYFSMLQSKLLRFDLCPRLADLKSRRLHLPVGASVPDVLRSVVDCDLNEPRMEAAYDELVRIATSIRVGRCSAVQALDRYGTDARGQQAYDAGVQLGMMLTSVYLIDYFTNAAFRAEVQHALNRGESMNTLKRAIHDGQVPLDLAKREESMAGVSSALSLLCNLVMAWNTEGMQTALDGIRAQGGEPSDDDLRRIAPTGIEDINLRGTFDFPVEKYAARLLPSSVPAAKRTDVRVGKGEP